MIGMIQFAIYLIAAHLVYKGIEIVYLSLGQGRGLIQQIVAIVLFVVALVFAIIIVHRADLFALTISSSFSGQ